jgi:hypothetical protein
VPNAKPLPTSAALGGPDFGFRLVEVGTATRVEGGVVAWLTQSRGSRSAQAPVSAGNGQEFLLVRFAPIPARSVPSTLPTDGVRLRVADEVRNVPPPGVETDVLVAVVPVGAPVNLLVTVGDREQSVDVRTGQVGPDAIPAYAAHLPSGSTDFIVLGQFSGEPYPTEVEVHVNAALEPYDRRTDGGRWAAPGRTWLRVSVKLETTTLGELGGRLDLAKSLQLNVNGRPVTGDRVGGEFQRSQPSSNASTGDANVSLDVAEGSVKTVTVKLDLKGTLTIDGKPTTFRTATSPQQTITIA